MVGGYPMHIDATCDKGKGGLFVVLDGLREWVLACGRIPSENEAHLRPIVDLAVALFGAPLSTMHDLGDAGTRAVQALGKQGVPDLVCHYHFLGAVGEKLFDQSYLHLRNILRGMRVRTQICELLRDLRLCRNPETTSRRFGAGPMREQLLALVFWVLEGDGHKSLRFPFALPDLDFVHRALDAVPRLHSWLPGPLSRPEDRAVRSVEEQLLRIGRDPRIQPTIDELDQEWRAFDELRSALRLTNAELPGADAQRRPSNSPLQESERLAEIKRAVDTYQDDLHRRLASPAWTGLGPNPDATILQYLEHYRSRLFGHPAFRDESGRILAIAPRTDNPPEHFFGQSKQRLRRRVGRAHLGRDLQQQPAQAAYVPNLRYPEYVRVLCGSLENLPAAIAALAVPPIDARPLVRDHRDSALIRRTRELLKWESEAAPALAAPKRPGRGSTGQPATVL